MIDPKTSVAAGRNPIRATLALLALAALLAGCGQKGALTLPAPAAPASAAATK
jgi:predicted small lipoprotein YifL